MKILPGRKAENPPENTENYPARIQAFIKNLDGQKSEALKGKGDSLDKLFRLVLGLHEGHGWLTDSYFAEEEARKTAVNQRDALSLSVEEKKREIRDLRAGLEQLGKSHSWELQQKSLEHQGIVESLNDKYDQMVRSMDEKYNNTVRGMNQEHKSETDRLKGQLLVNQDDSKPWPDDKLKMKFGELHAKIENIAPPARVRLNVPKGQRLPLELDSTGFLQRVDNDKAHILIKNKIWSVLFEHFFSLPFGFGVLGPANAQNALLRAYASWYAVLEGRNASVPSTAEELDIFRTSEEGNKWRSATFQSAFSIITSTTPSSHSTADVSYRNLESAVHQVSLVFSTASPYWAQPFQTCEADIREIAKLAREIALQFGVHPAYLRVVMPQHGQRVCIGDEYHDCYDGAAKRGATCTVDLVRSLGLQKVGNGRGESQAVTTIVPCEIFAQEGTTI